MSNIILQSIWLMLPAYSANVTPILVAKLPGLKHLNTPISSRLLGSHKTWRGLIFGLVAGGLVAILQQDTFVWGASLGLAALLGDAAKSFVKRQRNISPGESFQPWDQIDFALTSIVLLFLFRDINFAHAVTILVITFFLSYFSSYIGVTTKFKKQI